MLYLAYEAERTISDAPTVTPAGFFGRKMTVNNLIPRQMRVFREEKSHCNSVSFNRDCANAFQHYVN
ncbi:hypothetical protein Bca52824_080191 [Brassica carinata]|uniref:Uncharacterized protein n=1 Tax=Brassica carinata TaxID=52824 RepID=A0A8X7U009_BRACI|nr:hypothetical protein Bca52824_080191 [Brassica carinata]